MKHLSIAAVAAVLLTAHAAADEIHLFNGKPRKDVTILTETFKEISFRLPSVRQAQTVAAADVKEVVHDSYTDTYIMGLEAMSVGDFKKAAMMFAAEAGDPPARKQWLGQYARFNEGECYRAQRDWDAALAAYDKLLREDPETRFYGDAFIKRAQCYQAQGKMAEAKKAFNDLKGEVGSKGLPKRWTLVADFNLVRLDETRDPQKAFDQYVSLHETAEAQGVKDVANMARLRIGYSLITQDKVTEAKVYFQEIIDDRQASDLMTVAGAYNGLGNTHVASDNPSTKDWNDAMYAFGRTVFHYGDDLQARGDQEMLPEALFWFARCLEEREDNQEVNAHRARVLYTRVMKEFGSTEWARKAADR